MGEQSLDLDFTKIDLEADPQDIAEHIQAQSLSIEKWKTLVEAEQTLLEKEFSSLAA